MTAEEYIAAQSAKTYNEALAFAADQEGADAQTICGALLAENARLLAIVHMAQVRPDLFAMYCAQ